MRGTDLRSFRKKLLALADRLREDAAGIARETLQPAGGESSGGLSNAPLHLADLGTDSYEKELSVSLLENKTRTLEQIEEAVRRIDSGGYGLCQECGAPIARERLQVVPYTRHCIRCAREMERLQADLPPTGPE